MLKTGKIETSIHLIMISWVHIKQIGRERERQREVVSTTKVSKLYEHG